MTVTTEGGHIAELLDKSTGVNPLWIPPWPSIEPSSYREDMHPEYGQNAESKLLAGIMGHNLCLDMFGPPSDEEARAGLGVHGEASVATYEFSDALHGLTATCSLPVAQLTFERQIRLDGRRIHFREMVKNVAAIDRPLICQQHVTLGPPFLDRGVTQFRAPVTAARVFGSEQDFAWPWLPEKDGRKRDLQVYTNAESSAAITTQLLDPGQERGWAFAYSPHSQLVIGYVWKRSDYPWLARWEENCSRKQPPWNGRTLTLGLEFGTTPFPETRRQTIERHRLFHTPCYRWLPARSTLVTEYTATLAPAAKIPETPDELENLLH